MYAIDTMKYNVCDLSPAVEVMQGATKNKPVVFSAPCYNSLKSLQKDYHVKDKPDMRRKIGTDKTLARNCAKSLFVSGANYHPTHSSVVKMTFTEIGQLGIEACANLCAKLLGFEPGGGNPHQGLLAIRIAFVVPFPTNASAKWKTTKAMAPPTSTSIPNRR